MGLLDKDCKVQPKISPTTGFANISDLASASNYPAGELQTCGYQQAQAWINALTGNDETAVLNWRFIHDQDKARPAIKRRGTLSQIWQDACQWNAAGYGIFACINEMDGTGYTPDGQPIKGESGDTGEHVQTIRAHVVDLDNMNAMQNLERAKQHTPLPWFAVQTSPGKAHVYWPLHGDQRYQDCDQYRAIQSKLRQSFDGDKAVVDATRVLRVPGFMHQKGQPHFVTCYALPGYGIPILFGALMASVAHVSAPDDGGGRHPLGTVDLAAPSADWARNALEAMPVEGMTHPEFISFTAAWKQAAWTVLDADEARQLWLNWCERFGAESKGNDYNLKHWNSITETELGWRSLLRQNPNLNAQYMFQGATYDQPSGADLQATRLDFLDHQTSHLTTNKPVSSEVYRIIKDAGLPVGRDEFKNKLMITEPTPWDKTHHPKYPRNWTDDDDAFLRAYVQQMPGMTRIAKDHVQDGLLMYSERNKFNSVTDYLNGLQWDGLPRLNEILTYYFSASNRAFARLIGPKFLIGMVARAMNPGCKRDEMPILEGEQGTKKSTALNILAGDDYFSDGLPSIHDKDALQHLQGMWLIEIGELSALRKSEVEDVKRFVTSRTDKFRPPYGRNVIESPRSSVFAGTTNSETYLKDPTGARRFWPIKCGDIDLNGLRRDRDQLFAEAVVRWRAGERYWLDGADEVALARDETDARHEQDVWHDDVMAFVQRWEMLGGAITMRLILEQALGMTAPNLKDRRATGRIAGILQSEGYERVRSSSGGRAYVYRKK